MKELIKTGGNMIWIALVLTGLFIVWLYKKVCKQEESEYEKYEEEAEDET